MKNAWLVVDKGKIGSQNQCIGLAEALGVPYVLKSIHVKFPWYYLPRSIWPRAQAAVEHGENLFAEPFPSLIIASGRSSAQIAASLKKQHPQTKTIYLMDPRMDVRAFDHVIAPAHDTLKGPNVIESLGMLNRVTPEILKAEGEKFAPHFEHLKGKRVALLIGGASKHYAMDEKVLLKLGKSLKEIHHPMPLSLMITFSRRTTPEQRKIFMEAIEGVPAYVWDEKPPNPYFALLSLADFIITTQDSTSMVTEACGTGKPVYVVELEGSSAKFDLFYRQLNQRGAVNFFQGVLLDFQSRPLQETKRIAEGLKKLWKS